jgi:hypothetical protein
MASFVSGYAYVLTDDGGNQYTSSNAFIITVEASDGEGNATFETGDLITGSGLPIGGLTYLGWYLDGWIGITQDASTIYYLSNEILPVPTTFTANTDAFTPCFLAGTLIATPDGERRVEELRIGDPVLAADGRAVPVRWVGRRRVVTAFGSRPEQSPVEIAAGTFGPGVPARPLRLTADHAVLLDGVLVQAGALVGTAARRLAGDELGERYTVFHVETEAHDLILAEGLAAETFLDNVARARFDNAAEYEALYGDASPAIDEMVMPRVKSARQLPQALRARLAERAAVRGGRLTTAA